MLPIPTHLAEHDWYAGHLAWLDVEGMTPRHDPGDTEPVRADLSRACLAGVDLHDADLRMVNLSGAVLSGADLRGCVMHGATVADADLLRTDFRGADVRCVDISGARLDAGIIAAIRNT